MIKKSIIYALLLSTLACLEASAHSIPVPQKRHSLQVLIPSSDMEEYDDSAETLTIIETAELPTLVISEESFELPVILSPQEIIETQKKVLCWLNALYKIINAHEFFETELKIRVKYPLLQAKKSVDEYIAITPYNASDKNQEDCMSFLIGLAIYNYELRNLSEILDPIDYIWIEFKKHPNHAHQKLALDLYEGTQKTVKHLMELRTFIIGLEKDLKKGILK